MGTHPIFESDFDCLTDSTGLINQNGSQLINRWRYYEALSLKDVQPTCTTQTHQDCYQGRKEGSWRRLRKTNRWCQEWWLQKGRCRQTTKILPNSFHQKKSSRSRSKPFSQHARSLRSSITPGTVLIMLAGAFRGKRVVFLKQLASGLLLVTGPFKVNGVPMRRCTASACIATSTKLDISGVSVPEHVNDAYFKRAAAPKKTEDGIFEQNEAKHTASEQRKADQKAVDAGVLSALSADKFLKGYLAKEFGLSRGQYPHNLKF